MLNTGLEMTQWSTSHDNGKWSIKWSVAVKHMCNSRKSHTKYTVIGRGESEEPTNIRSLESEGDQNVRKAGLIYVDKGPNNRRRYKVMTSCGSTLEVDQ